MGSIKYYELSKDEEPNKNVEMFLRKGVKPGVAVDLGCGAGKDSVLLLKNGWTVFAVDINATEDYILEKLTDEEKKRFKFIQGLYQDVDFPQCDLVIANRSMHFLTKREFKDVIEKIYGKLNPNGHFIAEFMGKKDQWAMLGSNSAFVDLKEIKEAMEKKFDLEAVKDHEYDGVDDEGNDKHWHTITLITRAKNKNLVIAKSKNDNEKER